MGYNYIGIMGRLTADPELKTYGSEDKVLCNFTVAVDRNRKNADGSKDTDFIRCVCFGQKAEFLKKYFSKGRMIMVDGSLQISTYEKNGEKRSSAEVMVNNLNFCGDKAKDGNAGDTGGGGVNTATPKPDINSGAVPPNAEASASFFEMDEDASELPF